MSHKKWKGQATIDLPENVDQCVMTVCPGSPDQRGQKFKATMQAAAQRLDRLVIILASDLDEHNLKRMIPANEALDFARLRGKNWMALHAEMVIKEMGNRVKIVPMAELTTGDFKERETLLHTLYQDGGPVTEWFDYSADLNADDLIERKLSKGVHIERWALKQNTIDYLCAEYAMKSKSWERFGLPEIYPGMVVHDPDFFQKQNTSRPDLDLTIPTVYSIQLESKPAPSVIRGSSPKLIARPA